MDSSAKQTRAAEITAYLAEAVTTVAFARYLHLKKQSYHPHHTWFVVMLGVIISSSPAIILARIAPTNWRRYEWRVTLGFLTSAAIIIPWQLWVSAYIRGQNEGYQWGARDKETSMESEP